MAQPSLPPCRLLIKTQDAGWAEASLLKHLKHQSMVAVIAVRAIGPQWWGLTVERPGDQGCAAIIQQLQSDPALRSVEMDRVVGPSGL